MSKRITKAMAKDAAISIALAFKKDDYDKLKDERRELAEYFVRKYIPYPVRACVNEYKRYFYTTSYVTIHTYDQDVSQPTISQHVNMQLPKGAIFIEVECKEYYELAKIEGKMVRIEDERKELQNNVEKALVGLGTIARVEKELPEALKYLNIEAEKHLPERNYTELRQTLSLIKNQ